MDAVAISDIGIGRCQRVDVEVPTEPNGYSFAVFIGDGMKKAMLTVDEIFGFAPNDRLVGNFS